MRSNGQSARSSWAIGGRGARGAAARDLPYAPQDGRTERLRPCVASICAPRGRRSFDPHASSHALPRRRHSGSQCHRAVANGKNHSPAIDPIGVGVTRSRPPDPEPGRHSGRCRPGAARASSPWSSHQPRAGARRSCTATAADEQSRAQVCTFRSSDWIIACESGTTDLTSTTRTVPLDRSRPRTSIEPRSPRMANDTSMIVSQPRRCRRSTTCSTRPACAASSSRSRPSPRH